MDQPEPVDDWQHRPLSRAEASALLDDIDGAVAVWVMPHDADVRSAVTLDEGPDDAVIDIVVETATAFEMYSYTNGVWMDYGTQRKDDSEAPSMDGTLDSYTVIAGESQEF